MGRNLVFFGHFHLVQTGPKTRPLRAVTPIRGGRSTLGLSAAGSDLFVYVLYGIRDSYSIELTSSPDYCHVQSQQTSITLVPTSFSVFSYISS